MPPVSTVSGVPDLPVRSCTLFNGGFAEFTVCARQNALQQTQTGSAIRNVSSTDLHTTLTYSHSALNLATLPHLFVAVPKPARRSVKGAQGASRKAAYP
jgi:hypothetical protein